jgi:hypothetical protein
MPRKIRSLLVSLLAFGVLSAAAAWQAGRSEPEPPSGLLPVLQADGARWWKGNLHTHSLWSDGDDFPEMIADWYKRHGYHFLALSDHNVLSEGERWIDVETPKSNHAAALKKYRARFGERWVEERTHEGRPQVRLKPLAEFRSLLEEPGRFLLIPGEEITHRYAKAPVHLNAINLRDVIMPVDGDSITETIQVNHRLVAEQGKRTGQRMLAFLNHPNFGWGVRAEDMIAAEELRFFEVFNGHPSVRNYGDEQHPGCEPLWDILLALRLGKYRMPVVYGLATDDAHSYHAYGVGKVNPGRGWLMVRAFSPSAETIVRALEAGDFYASTGVTLKEVRRSGDRLALSIQGEEGVAYRTQFIATLRDAPLTSAPRSDAEGKPLPVTRVYSPEIGKVVAEVEGLEPSYQLTGKELYVRAKVISTKPHPNPYQKGDVEVAWTQPVVP